MVWIARMHLNQTENAGGKLVEVALSCSPCPFAAVSNAAAAADH